MKVVLMATRGIRPARAEIDAAALRLLARHGAQILATARRYATTPEDAEDAYQRAIEILLTKAPSTREQELIPWLKTVVKHEAFALRRQRERHSPVTDDGELRDRPAPAAVTHEQAERLERLRQGAEALGQLKPHEVRALLLKAEGFSYREICAMTGWSYTKVNRLLTEGRRAFLRRVSGIERGAECRRFEPLLSALADGEASEEQLALLRPHMRTCLSCRATLREFRAAPRRVASVIPAVVAASSNGGSSLRSLVESAVAAAQQKAESAVAAAQQKAESAVAAAQQKAESAVAAAQQKAESAAAAAQHKAAAMGERLHAAAELATGQKLAAVAASAAALAGGGTAIDELSNEPVPPPPQAEAPDPRAPAREERPSPSAPVTAPADAPPVEESPSPEPTPAPAAAEPAPAPEPAREFAPAAAAAAPAGAAQAPPARSPVLAPSPSTGTAPAGEGSRSEFAP